MAEMSRAFGMPSLMPTWSSSLFDLPATAADLPAMTAKRWGQSIWEIRKRCIAFDLLRQFAWGLLRPAIRHAPSGLSLRVWLHPCTLSRGSHRALPPQPLVLPACSLAVDVKDTGKELQIVADVPGMSKEDIRVQVGPMA